MLLAWAFFWAGVLVGFVMFCVSTCNFTNIGWYFHDLCLDKRHVHRIPPLPPKPKLPKGEHDFVIVGGYDPELDGPYPEWGRVEVMCKRCSQRRRIYRGLPLDDLALTDGCLGYGYWDRE